ncbi:hypothetical protein BKI52_12065 [marine bacterium AO1-C]|nr:hypothetical protein BKI52_12065 [marine bacterium AO1-C]
MSEIRIPLPNGTQLIFFQSEQMKNSRNETMTPSVVKTEEEVVELALSQEEKLASEASDQGKTNQQALEQQNNEAKESIFQESTSNWPFMMASVNELQEISLALIYYKTYLQGKGQKDKAEQIGEIDHKVFQTLQQARRH